MLKNLIIIVCVAVLTACSQKVVNPEIQKLEKQKQILQQTSRLNQLKLDLENELTKVALLSKEVKEINDDASDSAKEAKSLSDDLSSDAGNSKLSSKADKAAKKAAKDAKNARKVNEELGESNDKVKSLQKQIEETEKELNELDQKIDFVPVK